MKRCCLNDNIILDTFDVKKPNANAVVNASCCKDDLL